MKPKLIDFKLLNEELKLTKLNNELNKALNIKSPIIQKNNFSTPNIWRKTSILFNLVLGLIIISIPMFLYHRYKTKPSKFEKDKQIIDVVNKINNKIGLNNDYIENYKKKL